MRTTTTIGVGALAGALALALAACGGSQVSEQMRTARDAFADAQRSPAAQQAPDALHDAQQALTAAERAEDGSAKEQHLAYIAIRKANLAEAQARVRGAENERQQAEQAKEEALRLRASQAEAAQEEATTDRQQIERDLARVRAELEAQGNVADARTQELKERAAELEAKQQELAQEKEARLEAEQKYQAAMSELEEFAKVENDPRGVVITLSGQLLFKTGESKLLPVAQQRLNQVAAALMEADQQIVIEGHTDSRGAADYNQGLSKARAEAVRTYLIEQGVSQDKVMAVGMGESQPIAENTNAEGRANNRRVEIIVRGQQQARR